MLSARINGPGKLEYVEMDIPEIANNEVLIKVKASGICGTDVHIYDGDYLGAYPIIPGHEFSGIIEKCGSSVSKFKKGDRVAVEPNICCNICSFCLRNQQNFCENWQAIGVTKPGGMSEFVAVPEVAVFNIGNIPFEQAAFMEPLSCVIHGISQVHLHHGARVAILGSGPIGILLLQVARLSGAGNIDVAEQNIFRLNQSAAYGADHQFNSIDDMESNYYHLVIDATGSVSAMAKSINLASPGGCILFFGVPPKSETIDLKPFILFQKGLTIRSTFTSLRNSYQAISLIEKGLINTTGLISHRLPLNELDKGLNLIKNNSQNTMKVIIKPDEYRHQGQMMGGKIE